MFYLLDRATPLSFFAYSDRYLQILPSNRHRRVETYSQIALVFGTGHTTTRTTRTGVHNVLTLPSTTGRVQGRGSTARCTGCAWGLGLRLARGLNPNFLVVATSSGVMCIGWSCGRNRKELGVGGSDPCNPLLDLVACTAVPSRLGLKARDHTFTARADRRVDQIGCDTSSRRHPTPLNCFASKLR